MEKQKYRLGFYRCSNSFIVVILYKFGNSAIKGVQEVYMSGHLVVMLWSFHGKTKNALPSTNVRKILGV